MMMMVVVVVVVVVTSAVGDTVVFDTAIACSDGNF